MASVVEVQDPLIQVKTSLSSKVGLSAASLAGSFLAQVVLAGSLMLLAPFCSVLPLREDGPEVIELVVVESPEILLEPEIEEREPTVEEPEPELQQLPPEQKESEREPEVVEEEAPVDLTEDLPVNVSELGDFSIKVGKEIAPGTMTDAYIDPKNLSKKMAKERTGRLNTHSRRCSGKKARVKKRTKGPYPIAAQRRRLEGVVIAIVTVAPDGNVSKVRLVKRGGHGFDESATGAFREWKFSAAEKNCEKIESEVRVTHDFTLD